MAEELKPCPLCGGEADTCEGDGAYFACCKVCSTAVGEDYTGGGYPNFRFNTPEEAIAAWNRRPAEDAQSATIALLERRVETLEAALRPFAKASQRFDEAAAHFGAPPPPDDAKPCTDFTHAVYRRARAALKGAQ